jgi:probable addiction module antidote protein
MRPALSRTFILKNTRSHDDFMRERLADAQFAARYLQSALEDGDPGVLLLALRRIAEARGGMAKLARATGLTREALYRTLSATGNPRLSSLTAILDATGLQLAIVPAEPASRRAKRATPASKRPRVAATA